MCIRDRNRYDEKGFRKFFGQVDHIGRYKRIDHKLNERGFEENENKM